MSCACSERSGFATPAQVFNRYLLLSADNNQNDASAAWIVFFASDIEEICIDILLGRELKMLMESCQILYPFCFLFFQLQQ